MVDNVTQLVDAMSCSRNNVKDKRAKIYNFSLDIYFPSSNLLSVINIHIFVSGSMDEMDGIRLRVDVMQLVDE